MAELLEANEIFYTEYEPKLSNRFIMYIDGIPSYVITAAGRPQLSVGKVTIDHINVKRYVKGKSEWQPITITLNEPIAPSAAQAAMEWIRLSHESVTGRNGYHNFYAKDVTIKLVDPVGAVVEQWVLKGTWVENFNPSALDWSNQEKTTIELTLAYNYAILEF